MPNRCFLVAAKPECDIGHWPISRLMLTHFLNVMVLVVLYSIQPPRKKSLNSEAPSHALD